MDIIRNWAVSVIFAALAAGLVSMLAPSGSMERVIKTAIAAFFICAFIAPLISSKSMLDLDITSHETRVEQKTARLKTEVNTQIERQVEARISALIDDVLKENGASAEKITVNMDRAEDGSISIKQTSVILQKNNATSIQTVKDQIETKLGITPDVSWGKGGGS